jgi:hypothetical protein
MNAENENFRHGNISIEHREIITVEGESLENLSKEELLTIVQRLVRDIKKIKDE